jgi:uncharacterized repeat protein (TIGR03987 family)
VVLICLALVLYSIGVWSERLAGRLKLWHLLFFWAGLVCDTAGTGLMADMAGGIQLDVHGATGVVAIVLMVIHAVWASFVLWRKDERAIQSFHRFSVFVWVVWLVPFGNGMVMSM